MTSGTAASASSSSDPYPMTASILACSSSVGPMWRPENGADDSSADSGVCGMEDLSDSGGSSPSVMGPESFTRRRACTVGGAHERPLSRVA